MKWYDLAGSAGVVLIVAAFLLLQLERVASNGLLYLIANAIGAALILLSLAFDFNLSAFLMEAFWLAISLLGLARRIGRGPRPPVARRAQSRLQRLRRAREGRCCPWPLTGAERAFLQLHQLEKLAHADFLRPLMCHGSSSIPSIMAFVPPNPRLDTRARTRRAPACRDSAPR